MTGTKSGCPMAGASRRGLLLGLAAGGAGMLAPTAQAAPALAASAQAAPAQVDPAAMAHPFHGPHQAGITTAQQAAGLVVAFDVLADSPAGLERLLRTLTARIAFLTQGGRCRCATRACRRRIPGCSAPWCGRTT